MSDVTATQAAGDAAVQGLLAEHHSDVALERLAHGWEVLGVDEEAEQARDRLIDLTSPLLLFVVGEGNFGKSSTINALVGSEVAPVSRLPLTWKVDVYAATPEETHAELIWANGDSEAVSLEAARATCEREESEAEARDGESYRSALRQVIWRVNGIRLPDDVALVDTPGFSQLREDLDLRAVRLRGAEGIEIESKEPFEYWYHRADVVLWVFKATKLTDRDTLDALEALQPQGKPILGVITHMDRVEPDRRADLLDSARTHFGQFVTDFIPIVAKPGKDGHEESIATLLARLQQDYFVDARARKAEALERFLVHSGGRVVAATKTIADALSRNRSILRKTTGGVVSLANRCLSRVESDLQGWSSRGQSSAQGRCARGFSTIPDGDAALRSEVERILSADSVLNNAQSQIGALTDRLRSDIVSTCSRCAFVGVRVGRDHNEVYLKSPDLTPIDTRDSVSGAVTTDLRSILTGNEELKAGVGLASLGLIALGPWGLAAGLVGLLFADQIKRKKLRDHTKKFIATWFPARAAELRRSVAPQVQSWTRRANSVLNQEFEDFSGMPAGEVAQQLRQYRTQVLAPLRRRPGRLKRFVRRLLAKLRLVTLDEYGE